MKTNIIHLTDLHIGNIKDGSGEFLRESFYEEYIRTFTKEALKVAPIVDALVVTGDFIHQGKTENFPHATKVIDLLARELKITNQQIGVCIGNHDIVKDLDDKGEHASAREAYNEFAAPYTGNLDARFVSNDRIVFKSMSEDILYISLDATLMRKKGQPGKISNAEIDMICREFEKLANCRTCQYTLILIGSHYPLAYMDCLDEIDATGWYDQHFWKSGEQLRRRINKYIKHLKVVWLAGDIHNPSFLENENNLYVVSGRFGTASELYEKNSDDKILVGTVSYVNRQANLIQVGDDHHVDIYNISQFQKTHGFNPHEIEWSSSLLPGPHSLLYQPALISGQLDRTLHRAIIDRKLFDLDKTVVDEKQKQVSWGWVAVDRLFSDMASLSMICTETVNWLLDKDRYPDLLESEETIFIGLDFWGSIVVSNLSILTGVKNICIPSKGGLDVWTTRELLQGASEKFARQLNGKKRLIMVADVVATGKTLMRFIEKLRPLCEKEIELSCISLICDIHHEARKGLASQLKHFGTCCQSFRLPVFPIHQMPDLEVLERVTYREDN